MKRQDLKILLVEDSDLTRCALAMQLDKFGKLTSCSNLETAMATLAHETFDLVISDLNLTTPWDGFEVVKIAVKKKIYCVVLSGYDGEQEVSKAYGLGCQDYYQKGRDGNIVQKIMAKYSMVQQRYALEDFFKTEYLTTSSFIKDQIMSLVQSGASHQPVLLLGPTGTGKTVVARRIHEFSGNNGPFVELNCAALAENLLESELFGYRKGAFTGAAIDKEGLLTLAHGGTLFLDEIGAMSLSVQAKLLKAIEEQNYWPVGATKPVQSSFRVVAATCEDIAGMVKTNRFREDLLYRIMGINIHLPPLRDRTEDVELLIKHFLRTSPRKVYLSEEASQRLREYEWPGNVRELRRVMELLVDSARGIILLSDLPAHIALPRPTSVDNLLNPTIKQVALKDGLHTAMDRIKNELIKSVTDDNQGKVNKTLTDLGISSSTYYKSLDAS